jgi:hypothetical protein
MAILKETSIENRTAINGIAGAEIPERSFVVLGANGQYTKATAASTRIDGLNKNIRVVESGKPGAFLIDRDGYSVFVQCEASDVTVGSNAVISDNDLVVDEGTADAGTVVVGQFKSLPQDFTYDYLDSDLNNQEKTIKVCELIVNF